MPGQELAFTLVSAVVLISLVFFLRGKYPHRTAIGLILCFVAPSWGHFYLKTNLNWVAWCIFWSILKALNTAYKGAEPEVYVIYYCLIGVVSACVMGYRLASIKKRP